jgi:hypothetical protein
VRREFCIAYGMKSFAEKYRCGRCSNVAGNMHYFACWVGQMIRLWKVIYELVTLDEAVLYGLMTMALA